MTRRVLLVMALVVYPSRSFLLSSLQRTQEYGVVTRSSLQKPTAMETTTARAMISSLFKQTDGKETLPSLPRDVREAVTKCREATQEALKKQISRMDIEFPVGTRFGVEKGTVEKKRAGEDDQPTKQDLDRSDRELARLFVEMFQPVGGDNIAVIFTDVNLSDGAKKQWQSDPTASARIMSLDRRRKASATKKSKKGGFAAKLAAEIDDDMDASGPFQLPESTEVAIFVAPGPKELVVIEKVCAAAGMGSLVVLLNARLSKVPRFGSEAATQLFMEDFVSVFHLSAAPQEEAPGCLLYRAFPSSWVLARKPSVGQPKSILSQPSRPTEDDCKAAFAALELTGAENAVENVAGWFK